VPDGRAGAAVIPYGRISGYLMEARELLNRHDPGHGPASVAIAGIRFQLDLTIHLTRQAYHRQRRD